MTVKPCTKCGQVHASKMRGQRCCAGHISSGPRKGEPCSQPAKAGQEICRYHGGNSPQALAAAEDRKQREQIEALAAALTLGQPVLDKDPGEIIADQIAWRAGHVAWLRSRVQRLDPKSLAWGKTKKKVGGDDHGTTSEAKPSIWYQLYIEAQRDLEKLCLEAIRAGFEERRVRLAERLADALVGVIDGILADLGHDPNNPKTAEIVERHLRLVGE